MKNSKANVEKWRANHHKALEKLAEQVACFTAGKLLWRQLRRLEDELYAVCMSYTCGPDNEPAGQRAATLVEWETAKEKGWVKLAEIFGGKIPAGIIINSDPRGHMLKLDAEKGTIPDGMHMDWGRDGILAAVIE